MRDELQRFVGETVDIIYLDRNQKLTKRRIRVLSVDRMNMTAYCYQRKAPRLFRKNNVLAVMPAKVYA